MTDDNSPFGKYSLKGTKKILYNICRTLGKGWLNQRFALILRKAVLYDNTTPIIDAYTEGFRIRYYPYDNLSDRFFLFMPQFFDVMERQFLEMTLSPESTFIDIGGNSGFYSLFAANIIRDGKILSFEPHPEVVKRLTYTIDINNLSELISIKNIGVADENKMFHLSVNPTNLGGSSIVLSHKDKPDYLKRTFQVPCRPLLHVLQEEGIEEIDLLKIDIEGAEHLALTPFFEKSPKSLFPKNIIIESDDRINLLKYGYEKCFTTKNHNSIYCIKTYG